MLIFEWWYDWWNGECFEGNCRGIIELQCRETFLEWLSFLVPKARYPDSNCRDFVQGLCIKTRRSLSELDLFLISSVLLLPFPCTGALSRFKEICYLSQLRPKADIAPPSPSPHEGLRTGIHYCTVRRFSGGHGMWSQISVKKTVAFYGSLL
jgi:hypothetical protein